MAMCITRTKLKMSTFNFQEADVDYLFYQFEFCEKEAMRLAQNELPLPAYEHVMKASHTFNLLDARHAIGVTEETALHPPRSRFGKGRRGGLCRSAGSPGLSPGGPGSGRGCSAATREESGC